MCRMCVIASIMFVWSSWLQPASAQEALSERQIGALVQSWVQGSWDRDIPIEFLTSSLRVEQAIPGGLLLFPKPYINEQDEFVWMPWATHLSEDPHNQEDAFLQRATLACPKAERMHLENIRQAALDILRAEEASPALKLASATALTAEQVDTAFLLLLLTALNDVEWKGECAYPDLVRRLHETLSATEKFGAFAEYGIVFENLYCSDSLTTPITAETRRHFDLARERKYTYPFVLPKGHERILGSVALPRSDGQSGNGGREEVAVSTRLIFESFRAGGLDGFARWQARLFFRLLFSRLQRFAIAHPAGFAEHRTDIEVLFARSLQNDDFLLCQRSFVDYQDLRRVFSRELGKPILQAPPTELQKLISEGSEDPFFDTMEFGAPPAVDFFAFQAVITSEARELEKTVLSAESNK